ncbi:MAG: O-antigen ligase family protein [Pseudomonadota bacterium]
MSDPPILPLPIGLAASAGVFIVLVLTLRQMRGRAATFVISAIWLRFLMSAFHTYTYDPLFAGLSGNALGSIAVTVAGILLLAPRYWALKVLLPVYGLISLVIFSAVLNGAPASALNTVVKYLYFAVILIATYQALLENAPQRFTAGLLGAFAPLAVFQALSLALGVVKMSESDGSASYIGGYFHEASFSIALLAGFFVLSLQRRWPLGVKLLALVIAAVAIYLANYRTSILALAALAPYALLGDMARSFVPRQRALVTALACILSFAVVAALAGSMAERFGDIAAFTQSPERYIKPPEEFTREDMGLMSARAYIWSTYFYGWLEAAPVQQLFGHGPDSWEDVMPVYPHNTLLAALFELGVFGVGAMLVFWITMLSVALGIAASDKWHFILGHAAFFILNMATMALWQIEGIIFYALICGFSLHALNKQRVGPRVAAQAI